MLKITLGIAILFFAVNGCILLNKQSKTVYYAKLRQMEKILNDEIPGYNFESYDGVPVNYLLADLTDSLNIGKKLPNDSQGNIKFISGHFYHLVPALKSISYSFIIYLEGDEMKVFKYINCSNKGDNLDDVIRFAANKLSDNSDKVGIMNRIRNYRSSGKFPKPMDNYGDVEPNCN